MFKPATCGIFDLDYMRAKIASLTVVTRQTNGRLCRPNLLRTITMHAWLTTTQTAYSQSTPPFLVVKEHCFVCNFLIFIKLQIFGNIAYVYYYFHAMKKVKLFQS